MSVLGKKDRVVLQQADFKFLWRLIDIPLPKVA
jgi:hypothetical protein